MEIGKEDRDLEARQFRIRYLKINRSGNWDVKTKGYVLASIVLRIRIAIFNCRLSVYSSEARYHHLGILVRSYNSRLFCQMVACQTVK